MSETTDALLAPTIREVSTPLKTLRRQRIVYEVSKYFDVTVNDIVGPRQFYDFIPARYCTMWLLRQMGYSFHKIGKMIGNRDHSTCMHGCREASKRYDKQLKEISANIAKWENGE